MKKIGVYIYDSETILSKKGVKNEIKTTKTNSSITS